MESEALARAERYGVELEALGEAVGGRSFDDALRVMQPSAQQKIATLTRELKSLRAGQRRRRAIEDPQVKLQVAMARQGTVRNRKRKKEERLVRAMVERSRRVVVVAGAEKLGQRTFAAICPAERVGTLVTTAPEDSEEVAALRARGVEVLCV